MKNFFKPTKVTWWVFTIFFIFSFLVPLESSLTCGMSGHPGREPFWCDVVSIVLSFPFLLFPRLGMSEYSPSIVTLGIALLWFYLAGCVVSFLWYKFRPKPKLPETG